MKYVSKPGTTINIPAGATPKQIAAIKARADSGYGKDAQKIANGIKTKTPATPTVPTTNGTPGGTAPGGTGGPAPTVSPTELKTNNQNAINAAEGYITNLEGQIKPVDLSGAPKLLNDGDLEAERQSVYDSELRRRTVGNDANKAHDLEAQKQELANRGIAYNPGTDPNDPNNVNNVYARSIGSVNQRYDALYQNAQDAANSAATTDTATFVGANKTQNDQFLDTVKTGYQSQLDQLAGGAGALNALMSQYGIDQQTAQNILDRHTQLQIAKINNQRSGSGGRSSGGGGGGGGSGEISGGNAPGFGV